MEGDGANEVFQNPAQRPCRLEAKRAGKATGCHHTEHVRPKHLPYMPLHPVALSCWFLLTRAAKEQQANGRKLAGRITRR
jgi:hypothetical protein